MSLQSPRLLLVSDDPPIRQVLAEALASNGLAVTAGATDQALTLLDGADIVIIDAKAAQAQTLCLAVKAKGGPDFPVVALSTAEVAEADASFLKPVRLGVLAARINQLHARGRRPKGWVIGPWRFDPVAQTLEDKHGRVIRLTGKETAILTRLHQAGGVVAKDVLLSEIWGYGAAIATRTLETHIYRLRRKMDGDGPDSLLVTEAGGYRLAG